MRNRSAEKFVRKYRKAWAAGTHPEDMFELGQKAARRIQAEFYCRFRQQCGRHTATMRTPNCVFWRDSYRRLCRLYISAHTLPYIRKPDAPFTVRINVNYGPGYTPACVTSELGDPLWEHDDSLPRIRGLQLTVLPESAPGFLAWIINWIDFVEKNARLAVPTRPIRWWLETMEKANYGWEELAWQEQEAFRRRQEDRQRIGGRA